ncbi:autotransporter outer membrane beta-barrel domain-containing protein [Pseudomonas sp. S2_H01]
MMDHRNFAALKSFPFIFTLASLVPLSTFSQTAQALTIVGPGDALAIDANTAPDEYQLAAGAQLNANGATTQRITTTTGATVNLTGTTVNATGTGVQLTGSQATITNSQIGSDVTGLTAARLLGNSPTSQAQVSDSTITAGNRGIVISTDSSVSLLNTEVTAGRLGAEVLDGTLSAVNSSITGGTDGVRLRNDNPRVGSGQLDLDSTRVEGLNGAAITTVATGGGATTADINVRNGSTLVGSNGVMLDVGANTTANMVVDNSQLVGDVVVDAAGTANLTLQNAATLTGRLDNVQNLAINSNAEWALVQDSQIGNLAMNGGVVRFGQPGDFYVLSVANLSGNGIFDMEANFAEGKVDFLDVTGTAEGNHDLRIRSSGADPLAQTSLHVAHIEAGGAQFSLLGGPVDLGTYSYDLARVGNDWFLDASTKTISPGTQSVLALFNAAPTVWYGELTSLRTRMGELRLNGGQAGGWVRSYGNKFDVSTSSGVGYRQTQQGFSLGADAPLPYGDGQWLIGVMAGYSKSDLDLRKGSTGTVDSYYMGTYATWLDAQTGYYFDGVLKFNRFNNESKVTLSDGQRAKGDYDNDALGASLEFGRHIALDDGYFVEPFTQLSGVVIQGKQYDLDNGMQADGDRTHSLLGKVGSTAGRNFDLGDGKVIQPYVRAAWAHEFASNNSVSVNDNSFNNDLSGSRVEFGAGVAMSVTETMQVHADFDYSSGSKVDQPWGANIGVRYNW